ncbi:FRG domain-containing protein [Phycicoccus jejuensis]|uniref:FRG domain-containing protein n=1 Tax=Phycicoccus jejuensis TaxID=367299 RepID=UPI00384BDF12
MTQKGWSQEIGLSDWGEYTEFVRDVLADGHNGRALNTLWFRGQGDADWPLIASFDRIFGQVAGRLRAKVYDSMIDVFRERSALLGSVADMGHEELICVMQHYGAPTRVLDWSGSPYVAAYFAFASAGSMGVERSDSECAVFILNADPELFKGFHTVKLINTIAHENPRAVAQRGRFTLNLSSETDLVAELGNLSAAGREDDSWVITKITLPRGDASLALRDLELMGLSSESLFPGLEGVARYSFFRALDMAGLLDG